MALKSEVIGVPKVRATLVEKECLIGTKEVCAILGIKMQTLYHWRRRKRRPFTFYKIGRALMFMVKDIYAYIQRCKLV